MKVFKYVGLVLFLITFALRGESDLQKKWQERKELLMKDQYVAHYYTFEDIVDNKSVVKDLAGKGGDLSFASLKFKGKDIGKMTVVEGRFPGKKAVRLDLGYYYGSAVNPESDAFTVECWFRKSGSVTKPEGFKMLVSSLLITGGGTEGWRLSDKSAEFTNIKKTPEGDEKKGYIRVYSNKTDIPEGVWQHAAVTWNGKEMLFYLNGEITGRRKFEGRFSSSQRPLRVGFDGFFIVDIDEAVIHNRVLSPAELKKVGSGEEGLAAEKINKIFAKGDLLIKKKLSMK